MEEIKNKFISGIKRLDFDLEVTPKSAFLDLLLPPMINSFNSTLNVLKFRDENLSPNIIGDVYVDFIPSKSVNAVVFEYEKQEFIGITIGYFYLLFDLSCSITGCANFLSKTLPHESNPKNVKLLKHYYSNFWEINSEYEFPSFVSNMKDRMQLANALMKVCHYFAFFHELGHIVNGHLYLNKLNGIQQEYLNAYAEIGKEESISDSNSANLKQTIELFADNYAIERTLDMCIFNGEIFVGEENKNNFDLILYLFMLGINLSYRAFQFSHYIDSKSFSSNSSHPPLHIRIGHAQITLMHLLKQYFPEKYENTPKAFSHTIADLNEFCNTIGMPTNGLHVSFQDMFTDTEGFVVEGWNKWQKTNETLREIRFNHFGHNYKKFKNE